MVSLIKSKFPKKEQPPRTKIIGVTGTYGKTLVTHLIVHILKANGFSVSYLSTDSYSVNGEVARDSLNANNINKSTYKKLLSEVYSQNTDFFVVEMTSKNIKKKVYSKVSIDSGVVTNIVGDSMSYSSWEDYADTKVDFIKYIEEGGLLIINGENLKPLNWFAKRSDKIKNNIYCYWVDSSKLSDKQVSLNGISFGFYDSGSVYSHLLGDYSFLNIYLAIKLCNKYLEIPKILDAVRSFKAPEGIFDKVYASPYSIIVDAAKSPYQLSRSLNYIRSTIDPDRKIISLFGSEGTNYRDEQHIGEVLADKSNVIILAPMDPGSNAVHNINSEIFSRAEPRGARLIERFLSEEETRMINPERFKEKAERLLVHGDKPVLSFDSQDFSGRLAGINMALALADPGDVVYIGGKGGETSLNFGKDEYEWSDYEAIKLTLAR